MDKLIEQLLFISHTAAQHPRFIQGGGGNCSVKNESEMLVKASGYFLDDLTEASGYVTISLDSGEQKEEKSVRPSMETSFHLLLGPYVVHTHPIAVGALVCSEDGEKEFSTLFNKDNYLWIPYARPGEPLAEKILEVVKERSLSPEDDLVLFFESHGLCVSAADATTAITRHEETVLFLENYFGKPTKELEPPTNRYLTPDHAVYANLAKNGSLTEKQSIAVEETLLFARQVYSSIQAKNWQAKYIDDSEVAGLLNMDEEKYRQQLFGVEK